MTAHKVNADEARVELEREQANLTAKLEELGYGGREGPSYDPNFADSSQVTAEKGETEVLVASLLEALGDVEKALKKVEDGTYGICEGCGETIAQARLEAVPTARLCMSCASKR